MPSPFTQFRKRQKLYLALLGVVCMVAFVFGGVTCNQGPAMVDTVVASTKYGDVHESELARLRNDLELVNRFMMRLVEASATKTLQNSQLPPNFINQLFQFELQQLEREGLITDAGEETAMDTMILARKAEELGVVISDEAIRQFLHERTRNQVSNQEMAAIISSINASNRRVFDALRQVLLANRVRMLFGNGLAYNPPAQQWEYYQRLNRRARAEIVPISVSQFVDQVEEPSEETLRKFFEENKNRLAQPDSPEVGFKQPHKVALQYLKADYDKFYNEAEITDEEIAEHYEKHKDRYPYTEPPREPDEPQTSDKPADEKPADEKSADDKPAPEKPADEKPEAKKPADEKPASDKPASETPQNDKPDKPADGTKPADEKPANEKPTADKPTDEKPAEQKTEKDSTSADKADSPSQEEPQEKEPSTADDTDSCQSDPPAEAKTDAGDTPADSKPATENDSTGGSDQKPETQPASSSENPTQTTPNQPAETEDAAGSDAATDEASKPKEEEKGPSLLELSGKYGLPRDLRGGPKPPHAPLWHVKDRIRRELAGERARKRMEEVLGKIRPVLEKYFYDLAIAPPDKPPQRPDFVALAKQHDLSAHETGLLSVHQILTETDIGQAIEGRGPAYVNQIMQSYPVFKDDIVQDSAGNQFLFWKSENVPEHVPDFADAATRREVLAVWKQVQARELARKRAEELAAQARKAQKPLAEVFAENKDLQVSEVGPFSWLTQGSEFLGSQEPRVTSVPGVETPGNEFMRSVFALSEGEVGVAFNAPQTEAFVVRVTSMEPSRRVLLESFSAENASPRQQSTYAMLSFDETMQLHRHWLEEVRATAGLHWNREPYTEVMR